MTEIEKLAPNVLLTTTLQAACNVAAKLPRGYSRVFFALGRSSRVLQVKKINTRAGEMFVDYRESVCAPLIKYGCYPHQMQEDEVFTQFVKPGATVFDIGANIGWFSCLAHTITRGDVRVIAVEPMPRALRLLERNAEGRSVTVLPYAIGEVPSICSLCEARNLLLSTVKTGSGTTRIITIDEITRAYGAPHFIKIDVEGAELTAFRGGTETFCRHRPVVMFEYLPENDYSLHDLTGLLPGYEVSRIGMTHNYFGFAKDSPGAQI
jgi:FkbM family methyltransferase